MSEEIERVRVTVQVEPENITFTYLKSEWDEAVADGTVDFLMDHDLSNLHIQLTLFGPDGEVVEL